MQTGIGSSQDEEAELSEVEEATTFLLRKKIQTDAMEHVSKSFLNLLSLPLFAHFPLFI